MARELSASGASVGKRVVLMTCGSRGDIQPFVALASGLTRFGFRTLILTDANHVEFVKSFGLDVAEVTPDTEHLIRNTPGLLECMIKGNWLRFVKIIGELLIKLFPENMRRTMSAIEDFRPDMLLASELTFVLASAIGASRGIPVIKCDLFGFVPTGFAPSLLNEPAWMPAWVHRAFNRICEFETLKGDRIGKHGCIAELCPTAVPCIVKKMEQLDIATEFWPAPLLIASSAFVCERSRDWAPDVVLTGHWVIDASKWDTRLTHQRDEHPAAGDSDTLQAFLEMGPPPVYIGWGSMICVSSEFMACTALRALKLSSMRGVILGGWARLSMEHLRGHPDSDDLIAYATENVLFLRTAPHEWLLPRCAASVHHGGAGTTAAALRSGRPTIVTPCGFDQPMQGRKVVAVGAGLALPPLADVTPPMLADALRKATTDSGLIDGAATIGEALRAEDGVGAAVRFVDDFFSKEVATGAWAERSARLHAKLREYESPSCCTRLAFLCAKLCTNSVKCLVTM